MVQVPAPVLPSGSAGGSSSASAGNLARHDPQLKLNLSNLQNPALKKPARKTSNISLSKKQAMERIETNAMTKEDDDPELAFGSGDDLQ